MELTHFTLFRIHRQQIPVCRINFLYIDFLFFLILGKHEFYIQMYTFFPNIGK